MALDTQESWLLNAVAASGRCSDVGFGFDLNPIHAIKKIGRSIGVAERKISNSLKRVPVVGTPLSSAFKLGAVPIGGVMAPVAAIDFAAKVANGTRIDKAAYGELKDRVKAYQDIAPYAQTVISTVPGIGQGVSAAIGAANALSKGQPITQALIEGARGAIPGGPAAVAAFDVSVAAIQGKPLDETLLQAIPLPPEQKQYIVQSVLAAKDIANGKPVDEAVYNRGRSLLPTDAQKALDVGVAIAQGQKLQQIAMKAAPSAIPGLATKGFSLSKAIPVFAAGSQHLEIKPDVQHGFHVGLGASEHKATPLMFKAIRDALKPNEKQGFDLALSTKVGMLSTKPPSNVINAKEKFGFFASAGMQGAQPKNKIDMLNTLVAHPEVKKGVTKAVKHVKSQNKLGFLAWLKQVITGKMS